MWQVPRAEQNRNFEFFGSVFNPVPGLHQRARRMGEMVKKKTTKNGEK
jgi:hypothetical protein